ncbi:MAG: hypothetical protein IT462_08290 [Planctomycetes bacterium]|nr:hypothetical protein [Planctomycetota bacterium]
MANKYGPIMSDEKARSWLKFIADWMPLGCWWTVVVFAAGIGFSAWYLLK